MAQEKNIQIDVSIMGQPYKLACKEGGERALQEAVSYVDEKMCAIRDAGKIKGTDRIAVMAALAMASEFLSTKTHDGPFSGSSLGEIKVKIDHLNQVIEQTLTPQEKLF